MRPPISSGYLQLAESGKLNIPRSAVEHIFAMYYQALLRHTALNASLACSLQQSALEEPVKERYFVCFNNSLSLFRRGAAKAQPHQMPNRANFTKRRLVGTHHNNLVQFFRCRFSDGIFSSNTVIKRGAAELSACTWCAWHVWVYASSRACEKLN